jgi:isoleucyl-tRNA synthetase
MQQLFELADALKALRARKEALPKILKDTFCKYKTMQGYKVLRKVGWDTHGLPVELEVEKELGFKSVEEFQEYLNSI